MPLGELACLFSALAWAVASAIYKKSSATAGTFQVNLFRCSVAVGLGLFSATVLGHLDGFRLFSGRTLTLAAVSGIAARMAGDSLFLFAAARNGLARTMPISSLYPVWATVLARIYGGEATPLSSWASMGLALGGVILVMRSGLREKGDVHRKTRLGGYALALAASLVWSLSVVSVHWGSPGLDPVLFNVVRMASGGLSLALILGLKGEKMFPRIQAPWKLFAATALESWLGAAAYVYGLGHSSTAVGATLSSLAPVITIPIASFYLKERMSKTLIAGILLATLGVAGLVSF